MTTPGKLKSEALNLNSAVRFGVLMPKTRVRGEARAQSVTASELIERLDRVGRLPYLVFCRLVRVVHRYNASAAWRNGWCANWGIPAVIGMTERVTIKTAHALAEAFYRQFLAQGKIGEVDRALVEAYAGLSGRTDVNVMSGGITDWALVGVTVRKSPQTNAADDGV